MRYVINMEDRGASPELLHKLYIEENKPLFEIRKIFNIKDEKVLNRWLKESNIEKKRVKSGNKYTFNSRYFDHINTEDKAYWLGFVWCDGYVCKRDKYKNGKYQYEFKLSLMKHDYNHLEKLKSALESNHQLRFYKYSSSYGEGEEARLYICNKHFGSSLYEKHGLIPNRCNIDKLINHIPENLIRHFIRGVLDADGSIGDYLINDNRLTTPSLKHAVRFYTYENLLDFIQEYFYINKIIKKRSSKRKRHQERDGYCSELSYGGTKQVPVILNHLYGGAKVYLDRKYETYLSIINRKERDFDAI